MNSNQDSGYLEKWKGVQKKYITEIENAFSPIPIKKVNLYDEEVIGFKALSKLAHDVYQETDPAEMMYEESPIRFERKQNLCEVHVKLPFADASDIQSWVSGDELFIQLGNQRKVVSLPLVLAGVEPGNASYKEKWLTIPFAIGRSMQAGAINEQFNSIAAQA